MAKIDYNFDLGNPRPHRNGMEWERKVRIALLFGIVTVITGIVIYAIVPSSRSPKKTVDNPVEHPAAGPDAQKDPISTGARSIAGNNGGSVSVPVADPNPGDKTAAGTSVAAPPAGVPKKGEVGPGDPPSELDRPRRSGPRNLAEEAALAKLLNAGDYRKFFDEAAKAVAAVPADSEARAGLGALLAAGRKKTWRSGEWKKLEPVHKVVSGNNISMLARKYHTTMSCIRYGNDLKNNNIRIGQRLHVIPGPWKLSVSRKARLLTVYRKGAVFAVFPVGIGRQNTTPAGKFVISHRQYHPSYRDEQGRVFKYGDGNNPLGEARLMLALPDAPDRPYRGYGIHGTGDNTSVGRSVSNGCIRMHNDDVTMLYYLLPERTPVEITE